MLRPWWIGMLLLCLVVAGVFAWLGQWQLERAIDTSPETTGATEKVQPIADVVGPSEYLPEPKVGQRVDAVGNFVADDFLVVSGRFDDGVAGYWVTGQLRLEGTSTPTSVAVAVGFTPDRARADASAAELNTAPPHGVTITGRLISDEGPVAPSRSEPVTEMAHMSPAALLNLWHDTDGVEIYRPYLTSDQAFGGLEGIESPAPEEQSPINWLNLFYAAEWIVFAGFAFYLWYRLTKDAWEKELEELEEQAASSAA
ncbi:SURF1 family protein [Microbacterium gorillae]|uniref:SURF1 family protein n=1 Tax=Microbacterium gorillae TaxID=1231063 RepID=UPI000694F44D|nr:SURF1 family protein [Microbacterium gorillae]